MDAERQAKTGYWERFNMSVLVNRRLDGDGDGVTEAGPFAEEQASPACTGQPTLSARYEQLNR